MEDMECSVPNFSNMDQDETLYCICRSSFINVFMIMCDFCEEWYHGGCIGVTIEDSRVIDKFCCQQCAERNTSLKTTYKPGKRTNKKLGSKPRTRKKPERYIQQRTIYEKVAPNKDTNAVQFIPSSFDFVDSTVRTSKTDACKKPKQTNAAAKSAGLTTKLSNNNKIGGQCYGPGCKMTSRKGSKYCGHDCGIALAINRILEILPQRLYHPDKFPPAADELSQRKLANIRSQLNGIKCQFEEVEMQITELANRIKKSKQPENNFSKVPRCVGTYVEYCVLCGVKIRNKSTENHLENCYKRMERKIIVAQETDDDDELNIFCNHKISKKMFCKKLKVLCPFHYKNPRKDDNVCGYYLGEGDGGDQYCGNIGKICRRHPNWEENQRAELDLIKFNLILKFKELRKAEENIRGEMSRRSDLIGLLLHNTSVH